MSTVPASPSTSTSQATASVDASVEFRELFARYKAFPDYGGIYWDCAGPNCGLGKMVAAAFEGDKQLEQCAINILRGRLRVWDEAFAYAERHNLPLIMDSEVRGPTVEEEAFLKHIPKAISTEFYYQFWCAPMHVLLVSLAQKRMKEAKDGNGDSRKGTLEALRAWAALVKRWMTWILRSRDGIGMRARLRLSP